MLDPVEFGKAMAAIVKDACAPLVKRIEELEARQPERGEKGEDGRDGVDATPVEVSDVVKHLLSTDAVQQIVGMEVASYLQENPPAAGKDGADGKGEKGDKGDDGKSVTLEDVSLFLEAAIAKHVLELERRATDTLAKAIDKIPTPKDGKDGADFSDVEIEYDGERTITIKGRGGEIRKTVPVPLDRGYWRENMACEKGDIVTHDGNAWIAQRNNKSKPSHEEKDDWRLFARKGRDGRDGKDGKAPPGPVKLHD